MKNEDVSTMDVVVMSLNSAWQDIDHAQNAAYRDGMLSMEYKLRAIQQMIDSLLADIEEYGYTDDD